MIIKNADLVVTLVLSFSIFSCANHEKRETKYSDGKPKEVFEVLETKDGSFIKDGDYKTWYPGGQPESAGQYKEGRQMGNWKYWFSNGQMRIECSKVRDTLDGTYAEWYSNGQKLKEGVLKMGKNIGVWTSWYENGKQGLKSNYDQDGTRDGLQTDWYNSGKMALEETYKNGIKEGGFRSWDTKGHLVVSRVFKNGVDANLPAEFKNKFGEKIHLTPDGTFTLIFRQEYFNAYKFYNREGKYEVTPDQINFNASGFLLKKFKPDTIVIENFYYDRGEVVFVKQK